MGAMIAWVLKVWPQCGEGAAGVNHPFGEWQITHAPEE
jgi:hypothetical protein